MILHWNILNYHVKLHIYKLLNSHKNRKKMLIRNYLPQKELVISQVYNSNRIKQYKLLDKYWRKVEKHWHELYYLILYLIEKYESKLSINTFTYWVFETKNKIILKTIFH